MRVSVVTPTADRPEALALAERWMARQTRQPDEWIVADGGLTPSTCTRRQVLSYAPRPAGTANFVENLRRGLLCATGEIVFVMEDDEFYAPTYIERLLGLFRPETLLVGDDLQRYYNVAARAWRVYEHTGASLCQSAFRAELVPLLRETAAAALARGSYGVDAAFWQAVPAARQARQRTGAVVGIKGLPGLPGLGVGHRPDARWHQDPTLATLRAWLGDDADVYAQYGRAA